MLSIALLNTTFILVAVTGVTDTTSNLSVDGAVLGLAEGDALGSVEGDVLGSVDGLDEGAAEEPPGVEVAVEAAFTVATTVA